MKVNMIRKAKIGDVMEMKALINSYAAEGCMLPRSLDSLYSKIRDFHVCEEDGHVIGCCGVHPDWEDLAEVVSLAVAKPHTKRGIATELLKACTAEAREIGLKRLFVLTSIPEFFEKQGYTRVTRDDIPWKVWADCVNCPQYPDCRSVSLIRVIEDA